MSVYSMTGYAAVQSSTTSPGAQAEGGVDSNARIGVEIRAVNSRFLDLTFRLPDEMRQAEPALREILAGKLKRGKIEIRIALDASSASHLRPPSAATLQRLSSLEDNIKSWLPRAVPLTIVDVLKLASLEDKKPHDHTDEMLKLAKKALKELLSAREREGARLAQSMLERTGQLRALSAQAAPLVPKLVEQQKLRFLERFKDAMALGGSQPLPEIAQDRALAEATAFAMRIDVSEDEIERLLNGGGELGKRLDCLIQELHREANTLGSKSASLELTKISVEMKVLIEQVREQVQNIE
jgi:uncharacterized protein (TIGR00255 family)